MTLDPSEFAVCGVGELHPQAPLRPPETVMRLIRMGSFFPTRLSFMRRLLRDLATAGAAVRRTVWEVDDDGFGRAVYSVDLADQTYSLVAFSTPLAPEHRTDRVIAEAWDSSYVLYDGTPSVAELDRLEAAAPRQEAARYLPSDLVLSRANRSVRLFDHVVDRLADGEQPDPEMVASVGYLMRTTAVYGNGKFGIADRAALLERPIARDSFGLEMLAVWLIRGFTHDLVEHIAARRAPSTAIELGLRLRRHLGVGNSTGLGMAPFLVNHPVLINNWMLARETGLARVLAVRVVPSEKQLRFDELLHRATAHVGQWSTDDGEQTKRLEVLREELKEVAEFTEATLWTLSMPWSSLLDWARHRSVECGELLVALLLELYPELVNGLSHCMSAEEGLRPNPRMTVGELSVAITSGFGWALKTDFTAPENCRLFWYVSEDKEEPRLGDRFVELGSDQESPLDIGRRVAALAADLGDFAADQLLAEVCLVHPEHRLAIQRVQTLERHPYAEIRDNLIGEACRPIDLLRCKLSYFGASKFDPKSDRWTRVTLFQGAPLVEELNDAARRREAEPVDDWWLPVLDYS